MIIERTQEDIHGLDECLERDGVPYRYPPVDYAGYVITKPWGYEFQVHDSGAMCVWLACLRSGQAVSLHCHQRKSATFTPLTNGITLRTLHGQYELVLPITVEKGVFHSQENNTPYDAFFLEYESPSEKTDLIRMTDRYGRAGKGYEGRDRMVRLAEAAVHFAPLFTIDGGFNAQGLLDSVSRRNGRGDIQEIREG